MEIAFNSNPYTYEDIMSLPEDARCELIEGFIYNMAPPSRIHQKISVFLTRKIGNYLEGKECEVYAAPFGVFLLEDDKNDIKTSKNAVEPDIAVICDKNKLINEGCKGAPDFVIEITSPSTQRLDYVKKLAMYNDFGVREYWIVNPLDRSVFVYRQKEGSFERPQIYSFDDKIKVGIFDDFAIDFSQIPLLHDSGR